MSQSDLVKIIIDLLKACIIPGSIIFILLRFETEIKERISKIQKFSGLGISIETQQQVDEQRQANKKEDVVNLAKETAKDIKINKLKGEDHTEIDTALAKLWHFEKTYRMIFGSQLALLKSMRDTGLPVGIMRAILQYSNSPVSKLHPDYTFDTYIYFLKNAGLININDEDAKKYSITQDGINFLKYLEDNKIPLNKPF